MNSRRMILRAGTRLLAVSIMLWSAVTVTTDAEALEAEKIGIIETDMTDHICSSRDWLLCFGEDPNRCREIVHAFARPCLDQSLTGVRERFDVQSALEKGVSIITCFNKEFKAQHPQGKRDTAQCKELPDHLR